MLLVLLVGTLSAQQLLKGEVCKDVENAQKAYELGKQDGIQQEYDRFWDAHQNKGKRRDYFNAFAGEGWTDETFKPKYHLNMMTSCNSMFKYSDVTNLKQILLDLGKEFSTSRCSNFSYMFQGASLMTHIPPLDMWDCTNTSWCFDSCLALEEVELSISETTQFKSSFINCKKLRRLMFTRYSTLATDGLDLHWSPLLDYDSIISIFETLSSSVENKSITLSRTAVNNAFETSDGLSNGSMSIEWYSLVASRPNWTIILL